TLPCDVIGRSMPGRRSDKRKAEGHIYQPVWRKKFEWDHRLIMVSRQSEIIVSLRHIPEYSIRRNRPCDRNPAAVQSAEGWSDGVFFFFAQETSVSGMGI